MTNLFGRLLVAGLFWTLAAPASAAIINLNATLNGAQEVGPTPSPGTGYATLTLDDVANSLNWNISWMDLTAPATAMHFHGPATAGVNAGVQVNIGAISGLTSPSVGGTTITAAQAADLLNGLWYINVHTSNYPGGEIRGQVTVVPVPAAMPLLVSGLIGIAGMARKRRAA